MPKCIDIYTCSESSIMLLRGEDQSLRWHCIHGNPVNDTVPNDEQFPMSARSSLRAIIHASGSRALLASYGGLVLFWDLRAGQAIWRRNLHSKIDRLCFYGDSTVAVCDFSGILRLLNLADGEEVDRVQGVGGFWSSERSRTLVTSSADRRLSELAVQSGDGGIKKHGKTLGILAGARFGDLTLISESGSGIVRAFDAQGLLSWQYQPPTSGVISLALAPAGADRVAVLLRAYESPGVPEVAYLDLGTGTEMHRRGGIVNYFNWSPVDSKFFVCTAQAYDIENEAAQPLNLDW